MSYSEEQAAQREAIESNVKTVTVEDGSMTGNVISATAPAAAARRRKTWQLGSRWWMLAAGSAVLLTMLTVAAVYLLTRKPSTVDQLIILTVPSGANVKLDSKDYGHTPVKLEQLVAGTYTLTIEKENFEPVVDQITITDTQTLEYKLKVMPSPDALGSPEEAIRKSQDKVNEALARGQYLIP